MQENITYAAESLLRAKEQYDQLQVEQIYKNFFSRNRTTLSGLDIYELAWVDHLTYNS